MAPANRDQDPTIAARLSPLANFWQHCKQPRINYGQLAIAGPQRAVQRTILIERFSWGGFLKHGLGKKEIGSFFILEPSDNAFKTRTRKAASLESKTKRP
jgi:hypothetical protein